MRMVFLRGAVPPASEHPEKLEYSDVSECEDMWTQLFYTLLRHSGSTGELLYQGGERVRQFGQFTERWVPRLADYQPMLGPDVIICRGGFDWYDSFVSAFSKAFKVYYGAGERFFPPGFSSYDMFLVDTPEQQRAVQAKTKAKVELLVKPAAALFAPVETEKEYHVCFMANATGAAFKGHELFIEAMAGSSLKVMALGNTDQRFIDMAKKRDVNVKWGGWSLRKHLPAKLSRCRVGVCCSTRKDSCPRVIPEYLACGLPVVITEDVHVWREKYVAPQTGVVVPRGDIRKGIKALLARWDDMNPRAYYEEHLSMAASVSALWKAIRKAM